MKFKVDGKYIVEADSLRQAVKRVEKFKDSKKVKDDVSIDYQTEQELKKYANRFGYDWTEVIDGLNSRIKRHRMKLNEAIEDLKEAMAANKSLYDSKNFKDSYIYTEVGQDYSEIVKTLKSKGFNVIIMGNASGYGKYIKIEGPKDKLKALQNSGYFEEETIHDSTKDSEVKLGTLKPGDHFYDRRYKEDCVLLECDDDDCRIKSLKSGIVFRMSPNAIVSIKDSKSDQSITSLNDMRLTWPQNERLKKVIEKFGVSRKAIERAVDFDGYDFNQLMSDIESGQIKVSELNSMYDSVLKPMKDSEIDYLTQEEEQAVEDYRKAIQNTANPKLLEIYSHILQEETEHIKELEEAKKVDNLTEDDDLVDKYQQIVDKTIELFGRIGAGLYDELDEKGLWVDDRNDKYIVKRK